jgi:hypothetical protein
MPLAGLEPTIPASVRPQTHGSGGDVATLKTEHMLRVFENRVVRKLFAPTMEEVTEQPSKLHIVILHNWYSSPNIFLLITSKRDGRGTWHERVRRDACWLLVAEPERKRPLRKRRRRQQNNIKMDIKEMDWEGADRIDLTQDRDECTDVVNAVTNIRIP